MRSAGAGGKNDLLSLSTFSQLGLEKKERKGGLVAVLAHVSRGDVD